MIKLYVKEGNDEYWARSVRQVLNESGIPVTLCHTIDPEDNHLYLLLGSEYLITKPKRYVVIQTLATSPLTLKSGIDAYWMTQEYLELLQKAECIWECCQENVKVWKEHYQLQNVYYVPFGYTSCQSVGTKTCEPENYDQYSAIFIGGKRASQFTNKMNEIPKTVRVGKVQKPSPNEKQYNILYKSSTNIRELISGLKQFDGVLPSLVLISDFPDTQPDLPLVYALRFSGLSCVVEKSRDAEVNSQCEQLGCSVVPFIRLQKQLSKTIRDNLPSTSIPPKDSWKAKFPPSLLEVLHQESKTGQETSEPDNIANKSLKKKRKNKPMELYYREAIPLVEHELLVDGGISLKLGDVPDTDLPFVSICTPTGNRRWIFCLAIRNYLSIMYPRDKLEWVILDDGEKDIQDIVPKDKSVRYEFIGGEGERMSVAQKRNELVKRAKGNVIVFMDDDDFYLGESVLARVKSLLKYQKDGVKCVGCSEVASYDLQHGYAAVCSNGDSYLTESSMAFTKEFWEERPFQEVDRASEYRYFLEYRQSQIRALPFQFVTVALTHGHNTTGDVRSLSLYKKWQPSENWEATKEALGNIFDEETQQFLSYLKKTIPSK